MTALFRVSIALFCAIELYLAHMVDIAYEYIDFGWSDFVSVEFALLAVAACCHKAKRYASVMSVMAFWMIWVALTDWVAVFPGWLYSIETTVFCCVIASVFLRVERLPSYLGPNVGLAFYSGSETPVIGSVASLLPLPYSGAALVVDGRMMMPRRKVGKFVKVDLKDVSKNWTILDTGWDTTPEIKEFFLSLEGKKVSMANCVSAIKPALKMLGYKSHLPSTLAKEVLDGGR